MELNIAVANNCAYRETYQGIKNGKDQFEPYDIGYMFFNQEHVLGNVPVVEIGDPDIQQDIKDHGEIE
jgi:hypothetical protein